MSATIERIPTAANMRFDGGHPALELVNTIFGQVGGPAEHDVLFTPGDLLVIARRLGLASAGTPAAASALSAARTLRDAVDALLRARLNGDSAPAEALEVLDAAAHAALATATLAPADGALGWAWPPGHALAPVHRLALAAVELLADEAELARLRRCDACRWLFLDHSRGAGRRWCSMAWCGTDAKKRRYVERRRERRAAGARRPAD